MLKVLIHNIFVLKRIIFYQFSLKQLPCLRARDATPLMNVSLHNCWLYAQL